MESIDIDFRALLTKVKASGADLVYGGFVIDSGGVQIIQQMKALGLFERARSSWDLMACTPRADRAGHSGSGE